MHERIHFISHQGKRILFVDFSTCSAREVEKIARIVSDYVMAQPRSSVRVLVDFTGASFDRAALQTMKVSAVFDKPYIKASAWIGAKALPQVFYDDLRNFSGLEFPAFNSRPETFAWFVKAVNDRTKIAANDRTRTMNTLHKSLGHRREG